MNKKAQAKLIVYTALILALGVASYFYYNFLETSNQELAKVTEETVAVRVTNRTLDTKVLESKKFKDLEKINVEEEYLDAGGKPTSTPPSAIDVAKVSRRQSNPFKPF